MIAGDTATIFVDTEFKGNLAEMKKADFIKSLSRGLTLKGTASLEGLRVEKISDLEGAPNYKLVAWQKRDSKSRELFHAKGEAKS